jgi:flagellar protein FliS
MNAQSAALAYRQASFDNAPPIKIVRLLYEGAIRYTDRAAAQLAEGSPSWTYWVGRADAIVEELRVALDPTRGRELCTELERLYDFVQSRFTVAVTTKDAAPLTEARTILATLLEGWSRVETQSIAGS